MNIHIWDKFITDWLVRSSLKTFIDMRFLLFVIIFPMLSFNVSFQKVVKYNYVSIRDMNKKEEDWQLSENTVIFDYNENGDIYWIQPDNTTLFVKKYGTGEWDGKNEPTYLMDVTIGENGPSATILYSYDNTKGLVVMIPSEQKTISFKSL